MRKLYTLYLYLSACACAYAYACVSAQAQTLHYDKPATYFEEALVVGNGRLGAIVYGRPEEERIALNDITLWTGEPVGNLELRIKNLELKRVREALEREDYAAADTLVMKLQGKEAEFYQPLGTLIIRKGAEMKAGNNSAKLGAGEYYRELDLSTATVSARYGNWSEEVFASAPDSVIVVKITCDKPQELEFDYECLLPHEVSREEGRLTITGYASYAANSWEVNGKHECGFHYDPDRGIHFETIVNIERGEKEVLLFITNATSFNGFDRDPVKQGRDYKAEAERVINKAVSKGYEAIRTAQLADYQELYNRVELDLGKTDKKIKALPTDQQLKNYTLNKERNPELEVLYFQYSRYLLISCSRTPGVPANLQGLWNEYLMAPWRSDYTTNINLEENYWGAETLNLSEMHMPLLTFVKNLSVNGAQSAKEYYGVENGWCAGHNSDLWAMSNPIGEGIANPQWANWTMGGAWLATHIWEHYIYTGDKAFLRLYYPTLKGAAQFCMNWLIEKDGELITSPATSPENMYVTNEGYTGNTLYGGTADLALVRECLMDAINAGLALGVNDIFIPQANSTLNQLRPYKIAKRGNLLEWYHDWDDADWGHRHQSHLIGLYPGNHLTVEDTPELAAACAKSLELKGDYTTGWSTGWRINLYARLRDRDKAYGTLRTLLKYISPDRYEGPDKMSGGGTYPNLLDAHQPFQIDGNFGGGAGIGEMLMQSSATEILLLPACPEEWSDGKVKGLCARGGAVVDFEWKNGTVSSFHVTARNDLKTVVWANGQQYEVKLSRGEDATFHTLQMAM